MVDGPSYVYRGRVVRVYDGDSIFCVVKLGFTVRLGEEDDPVAFRLAGIDTPELNRSEQRPAGLVVASWLRGRVEGREVLLRTHKPAPGDKYGRWMAEVVVDGANINDELVWLGYAKRYDGGAKEPWTDDELAEILKSVV